MKATYPEPRVGYWYTPYFCDQLRQIKDASDLIAVTSEAAQLARDGIRARIYETLEAALADCEPSHRR